jgi:hypothetical protein
VDVDLRKNTRNKSGLSKTMHDFNLGNQIVEQNKILRSKNYEMDSRIHGLKSLKGHEKFLEHTVNR